MSMLHLLQRKTRYQYSNYHILLTRSASWSCRRIKPGLPEQHKHKDKINRKTKRDISSETCEDKTARIFLDFVFCSALGLCLGYDLMLVLILMSQARLHSFVLPFVLSLCLCLCSSVNQA